MNFKMQMKLQKTKTFGIYQNKKMKILSVKKTLFLQLKKDESKSARFFFRSQLCSCCSDNKSSIFYVSFETKKTNAGRQLERNLFIGDCETISENGQLNEMDNAKRSKKMRKEKRNSGKSNVSTAGKPEQERTLRNLDNCRNKFKDKIFYENQQLFKKNILGTWFL